MVTMKHIVVLEGVDGCGKTTVANEVAKVLGAKVIPFPDDSCATGPMVRDYLAKKWWVEYAPHDHNQIASAMAFQSLQVANRMERMLEIKNTPRSFVLARYWQSGWVYGQMDGLTEEWLTSIHDTMVKASVNILLDISPEVSLERQNVRGEKLERYEGKLASTEMAVGLYRRLWSEKPYDQWKRVDAEQDVGSVIGDVINCVLGHRHR